MKEQSSKKGIHSVLPELTHQQEKFCLAYLSAKNASAAYREAYNAASMKPETVNRRAFDLLQDGKIVARIRALREQVADTATLVAADVLNQIRCIALSDIARIVRDDGTIKLPHELDPATRAAIKSFKLDEYGRIEYVFWDKNAALDKAARILGLYQRDNQQTAGGILADLPRDLVKLMVERLRQLKQA